MPSRTSISQASPMALVLSEDMAKDNASTRPKKWLRGSAVKNEDAKTGSPAHVVTEHVAVVVQSNVPEEALKRHKKAVQEAWATI